MNAVAGARALIVMGVAGSGKTTLGEALARRLGWPFKDGDDLHPPANIAKMSAGQPLTDDDRGPYLAAVGDWIDARRAAGEPAVVTCSALKRAYRDRLREGRAGVAFVFMDVDPPTVAARLADRRGHFFGPGLLASQFADLEPPGPDEPVIEVEGALPTPRQVDQVMGALARSG
ncbi:MAG TPA: gluconokinase [Caulobacteraceae bacterium]|nr:gluconokinase [Caulobacteraceae bacterium]